MSAREKITKKQDQQEKRGSPTAHLNHLRTHPAIQRSAQQPPQSHRPIPTSRPGVRDNYIEDFELFLSACIVPSASLPIPAFTRTLAYTRLSHTTLRRNKTHHSPPRDLVIRPFSPRAKRRPRRLNISAKHTNITRKTTESDCAADEALLCARIARYGGAFDTSDEHANAVHGGLDDVGRSTEEREIDAAKPERATLGSWVICVVQDALVRRGLSKWC